MLPFDECQMNDELGEEEKYNDCILSGYLETKSLHFKQFKTQWIVLKNDNCLYLYQTNNINENPIEIIPLNAFKFIETISNDTFELISNDKKATRTFKAKSNKEMSKWIGYILKPLCLMNADDPKYDDLSLIPTDKHEWKLYIEYELEQDDDDDDDDKNKENDIDDVEDENNFSYDAAPCA